MNESNVREKAIKMGYKGVKFLGKWNKYDIYDPVIKDEDIGAAIGLPYFILAFENTVRLSEFPEEYNQISDVFYPEEPDEDEE